MCPSRSEAPASRGLAGQFLWRADKKTDWRSKYVGMIPEKCCKIANIANNYDKKPLKSKMFIEKQQKNKNINDRMTEKHLKTQKTT